MESPGSLGFLLVAQATNAADQNYVTWMIHSLGPVYCLLLPAVGLAVFIGAVLVVMFSKRPSVIAAYLAFVPLPLLVGLFATVQGMISAFQVMASSVSAPKPAELGAGISMALFAALLGLLLTFPGYLVVSVALFVRTLTSNKKPPAPQ